MLPVYQSHTRLSFESLQKLKPFLIEADWFDKETTTPPYFVLASDPVCLWFLGGCQSQPHFDTNLPCGTFAEGLWRHDVAELFICSDSAGYYREFNLSPGGAWWTCEFESYRSPLDAAPLEGTQAHTQTQHSSWVAALAVPSIYDILDIEHLGKYRANISFVTDSPQQRFYSWAGIESDEPDFHKTEWFENLQLIRI